MTALKAFSSAFALLSLVATPSLAQPVRGVTPTEVRIGTHLDLSGPITFWGVPQRNGHLMRVEEQNEKGGVHGRKIKLIVEDNGYDPKKGVLATQKLIQQDEVFAIVGALGTPIVLAALPIVEEAGVLHLFPGAPARRTFEPFNRLNFAMAAPYDEQNRAAIKYFVEKRGKKTIGVMYQDDDFGKEILQATEQQAAKSGAKILKVVSYKRGDTNFSSQIALLKEANPDLVLLATVVRETIGAMNEIRKLDWNVDVMASASACSQAVADNGKQAVEGLYVQCQYVPLDTETPTAPVKAWMERYEKRFNAKPDIAATMSYDMEDMVILALQRAGRDLTQDKFIKAMESIKNYQDIFGAPPLSFGEKQRLGTSGIVLTQIKGGRFVRSENAAITVE